MGSSSSQRGRGAGAPLHPWPSSAATRADDVSPAPPRPPPAARRTSARVRGLRELEFEHCAGHVSDAISPICAPATRRGRGDPGRARSLGAPCRSRPGRRAGSAGSAWRHSMVLGTFAVLLVAFGVALGAVSSLHRADPMTGQPQTGTRPLAAHPRSRRHRRRARRRVVPPEVLAGCCRPRLQPGRGRYARRSPPIRQCSSVTEERGRDDAPRADRRHRQRPRHADRALETFDKRWRSSQLPAGAPLRGQLLYR